MNQTDFNSAMLGYGAQIMGATADMAMQYTSQKWKEKEAKKVREWNEQMYQRQLEDNRENWRMMNEYNLPSAMLARLRDAGLNPLLYYNNGNAGVVAADSARGATPGNSPAASGDMHTNFGQALAGASLLRAQIDNMKADTEQKLAAAERERSSSHNLDFDLELKRATRDVDIALKYGSLENLSAATQNLSMQTLSTSEITFQTIQTMRQAREYEIKRYNLDESVRGEQLQQEWSRIANERTRISQGWKQLAIDMGRLANETKMTNEQVGALQWSVLKDQAMFGVDYESKTLDNKLKVWDSHLRRAGLTEKQVDIWNKTLKNYYLQNVGNEQIGSQIGNVPGYLWQSTNRPNPQDMFVIPNVPYPYKN